MKPIIAECLSDKRMWKIIVPVLDNGAHLAITLLVNSEVRVGDRNMKEGGIQHTGWIHH